MRLLLVLILGLQLSTGALAQTLTPQQVMDRIDADLDDMGSIRADAYMTQALRAARDAGPLDPEWSRVMLVNASMIMAGLAKYERGMALLDEAATLTDTAAVRDVLAAYTAYFHAWFGNDAAARATLAAMNADPFDILVGEEADTFAALLDSPTTVENSPGFQRVVDLLDEGLKAFLDNDIEQAQSFLRGMRLPPPLDDEPIVRMVNAMLTGYLGVIAQMTNDPQFAVLDAQLMQDLSVPESDPPALRADLIAATPYHEWLAGAIGLIDTSDDPARAQMVSDWLALLDLETDMGGDVSLDAQLTAAQDAEDWATVAALTAQVMDDDTLPTWRRALMRLDNQIAIARIAIDAGEPIDPDALGQAFAAAFGDETMADSSKLHLASKTMVTFWLGGQFHLANIVGIAVHDYVATLNQISGQSGESIAAQARIWRHSASFTIEAGYEIAMVPPDGSPPPNGVCQDIIGIEVCTMVLQLP